MLKYTYQIVVRQNIVNVPVKKTINGTTENTIEQRTITKKYIVSDNKEYEIPFEVEYATSKLEYTSCFKNLIEQYNIVTTSNIEQLYNEIINIIKKIYIFDEKYSNKNKVLIPIQTQCTLDGEPIGEYVMRVLKSKISYKEHLPITKQDNKKWLIALKKLMPVLKIKKDSHKRAANIIQHFVSNIRHYAGDAAYKAYHNNHIPFLYSEATGGTGKGMFINTIVEYCNNTFGENSTTMLTEYGSSEYSSALLAYKPEATYFKMNDLLNNVFDNIAYTTDEKYKARINLKSKVTSIFASNKLIADSNTRRFGVIEYETLAPFSEWTDEQQDEYGYNEDMTKYANDLFQYCPTKPLFVIEKTKSKSEADERIEDVLRDNIEILEEYVKNNTQITATKLMNAIGDNKMLQYFDKIQYAAFINNRILNKEMTKVKSESLKARFTKDYLTKLQILNTNTDEVEIEDCTAESLVNDSITEWNKLIELYTDEPTNDDFDNNKKTTDIIVDAMECKDKYDTKMQPISNNADCEYMMLAINKEGKSGRKQDDIIPAGFSFESDKLSMNEQQELLNEISQNPMINDACYSGNKSIHYHVLMHPTDMTNDEYKYCWHKLAKSIFKDKYNTLDTSMSNMNRLTRKPNAIRKNNGIKQAILYYSNSKTYFDPTEYIAEYKKLFEIRPQIKYEYDNSNKGVDYLKACYNKNHKDTLKLALAALENKTIPAGSNMIGCLYALKQMNIDKNTIKHVAEVFNEQHPTNISKTTINKFV